MIDFFQTPLNKLSSNQFYILLASLCIIETILCIFIVQNVACKVKTSNFYLFIFHVDTEIDWIAYMQEVKGFLDGQYDYLELKGDTGPLVSEMTQNEASSHATKVYPGAFVYLYSFLYYITNNGENVRLAQYLFVALAAAFVGAVTLLVRHTKTPLIALFFIIASRRIHSIFVLVRKRVANDKIIFTFAFRSVYSMIVGQCFF